MPEKSKSNFSALLYFFLQIKTKMMKNVDKNKCINLFENFRWVYYKIFFLNDENRRSNFDPCVNMKLYDICCKLHSCATFPSFFYEFWKVINQSLTGAVNMILFSYRVTQVNWIDDGQEIHLWQKITKAFGVLTQ